MSATTPTSSLTQSGTLSSSSSSSSANASNIPDPNQDGGNQYAWGPSIYLYGLLVILIFVFLVFICIAWRGYRTRRDLRMRSELAAARGLNIPAVASNLPTPILYEGWIVADEKGSNVGSGWDIKPTAISAIRPIVTLPVTAQQPVRLPLRQQLFGFNRRPGGTRQGLALSSNTLTVPPSNVSSNTNQIQNGEKAVDLSGAEGVGVTVLIALPNPARPSREKTASTPPSPQPSAHRSGPSTSTVNSTGVSHENEELPELVLGISDVGIQSTPSSKAFEQTLGGRSTAIPET